MNHQIYSEEGRVKRASKGIYTLIFIVSVIFGLSSAYFSFSRLTYANLTTYQKFNYWSFKASAWRSLVRFKTGNYALLTYVTAEPKTKRELEFLWTENEMELDLDEDGSVALDQYKRPLFHIKIPASSPPRKSRYEVTARENRVVYELLKNNVYQFEYYELFYLPVSIGFGVFLFSLLAGSALMSQNTRRKLKGVFKRGMRLHPIRQYQKLNRKADGLYISVVPPDGSVSLIARMLIGAKEFLTGRDHCHQLRIPRSEENKGTLILGDSGTGKSLLLHQIVDYARAEQNEPGVCYDPAAEFVQSHYREGQDIILNPLDERFPNWQLRDEIRSVADLDLIAESFFPSKGLRDGNSKFFNEAAQDVFKLILARQPSNEEIVKIISDPKAIDAIVRGTEVSYKIDPKAGSQRAAVLGSLAAVNNALRTIPPARSGRKNFSLTSWAGGNKRDSWLFLTMNSASRDTTRPLISAMLNILMRRLMSIPEEGRKNDAWWFVADELHTLNSLSALPEFVAECRKHGIRYVLGTQSKFQLLAQYGDEARMILAQPKLKIFYRCNEPEGAGWVSQIIGEQEINRTQVSESMPVNMQGRNTISLHNVTENRILLTREQIMSLPDLHAVWKFGDAVVPFKLLYRQRQRRTAGFVPRLLRKENLEPIQTRSTAATEINFPDGGNSGLTNNPKVGLNVSTSSADNFPSQTDDGDQNNGSRQKLPEDFSNDIKLDF